MPPRETITEAEITAIYRDTVDVLYGYASRKCGGVRQVAEDVTQETWLRAVREWRRIGVPANPIAWLTTVARNLILNDLRRRELVTIDDVAPSAIQAALELDELGDSAGIARAVNDALTRLPAAEAQLLEEFHFERRRVAQLAEAYGTTERAIEGRLRRARERLRLELAGHEITDGLPKAEGGIA